MADSSDKTLSILIQLGITGKDDAEAFKRLMVETGQSAEDLAKDMGVLNVSSEEVSKALDKASGKTEDAGKKAGDAAGKHMALHHIMGELNNISPGLGAAFHLVADAYREAGVAAEGGAVGVTEFNVALKEVLLTMGPLIIAMLSIQTAMEYWEMYKDKVEAAAKAQEEASKRIVESTHKAFEAVKQLDEAMHPEKKDTATKDEDDLKKRQQNLENTVNRQRELNKAEEDREKTLATTPEQKEAVQKKFANLDTALNEWRDKQNAAIEGAMMQTMQGQLAQLQKEQEELVKKSGPLFQMKKERGSDEDIRAYEENSKKIQAKADEAKAIREKLDQLTGQQATDAGQAAFTSETNREVAGVRGADSAAERFATGAGIAKKLAGGGTVSQDQAQYLIVIEQAITGHKQTLQSATDLMNKQSQNTEFAVTLLQHAHTRIDAVEAELRRLSARTKNAGFNSK